MIPVDKIKSIAKTVYPYVVNCFRHLHQYPELSFQEYKTSEFIQQELSSMHIPFRAGIAGTGILGRIEGKNPSKKIVALRADMDALPIQEAVDIPWKSTYSNVMHACGHDAHSACLLGAAKILNEIKEKFEGTVLLIFQPGEEKAPGGASLMLQDGLFDEYTPDLIIGQHVSEDYPTGTMAFAEGTIMASADEIHVTVRGKGGHGAKPHLGNDTVLAASQTIVALQQVRSRLCPPLVPMVLTFGRFIADGATNVIPNEIQLSGTLRTFDEEWRKTAKRHIVRIIEQTCASYGCTADITLPEGYPCVFNNSEVTRNARRFAEEWAGKELVLEAETRLTSEDFGFFSQYYPSCFYRFGVNGGQSTGNSHTPTFCIDEKALLTGSGGLAWIAYNSLLY